MNLNAITLEVWWSRLVAIADEAATTLPRVAMPGDRARHPATVAFRRIGSQGNRDLLRH